MKKGLAHRPAVRLNHFFNRRRKGRSANAEQLLRRAVVESLEVRTLLSTVLYYDPPVGNNAVWDTTTPNWVTAPNAMPGLWSDGDQAVFPTGTGRVSVMGTVKPIAITFQSTGFILTDGGNGSINLTTGGQISVAAGLTAEIDCPITGGPLTTAGAGTLVLAGSNSYSATTITAGTLQAGNDGVDATAGGNSVTLAAGNITLDTGSTLAFDSSSPATFSNNIILSSGSQSIAVLDRPTTLSGVISGGGPVIIQGPGTPIGGGVGASPDLMLGNSNTYTGSTTVADGGTLNLTDGGSIDSSTVTVAAGSTLDANDGSLGSLTNLVDGGTAVISDPTPGGPISPLPPVSLSGSGTLTVLGQTLQLTGTNTFDGSTLVTGGSILSLQNANNAGTGANNVTVNNGSILNGTGGTAGTVTVGSAGTLDPGANGQTGILNTGGVTLGNSSTFSAQINGPTAGSGYDQLNVSGGVSIPTAGVGSTLNLTGIGATTFGQQLILIQSTDGITGNFANDPEGTILTVGSESYSISYLNNAVTLTDVTPAALTSLSAAVISSDEIDLNWPASVGATQYDLSEYIGGAWVPLDTILAGTTNYQATGLAAGTSYGFEVAADDGFATSAYASASATTATPPIVTATGDATINENGTYTLSLSADSTAVNANVVTGWNVDWGDGNLIPYPGASPTISLPLTNPMTSGWSGLAIVATAETAATSIVPSYLVQADPIYVDIIPTAPTLESVVVNSASDATITWQDNSNTDANILLLRSDNSSGIFNPIMTFGPGNGSYDDTSLSPSATCQYEAESLGGLNGQVASSLATSSPVTTQSSDLGLSVTPGDFNAQTGNINVAWTYAGTDVSQWELESEDTTIGRNYQLVQPFGQGLQSTTLTAVTGDTYKVRLRADYTDGLVSDWDMQTIKLTPTLLPTVTAIPYTDPYTGVNSIRVFWTMPAGVKPSDYGVAIDYQGTTTKGPGWEGTDSGDSFDGYNYMGTDSYASFNIGDGQSATFRLSVAGLKNGGFGYSGYVTQSGTAGPKPAVTLVQNSGGSVTANWTHNASDSGYYIFFADQPYESEPVSAGNSFDGLTPEYTTGTSAVDPVVFPGDQVYVVIEALQNSTSSGSGQYTTTGPGFGAAYLPIPGAPLPGSPTNLVATLTNPTTVYLHWLDNSYNETGFDIYRSDDQTFETDVTKLPTTGGDVNQYTDTLPDETTTYYYRVYAYSSVSAPGNGGYEGLILDQITAGESFFHTDASQGGLALYSVNFTGGAKMVGSNWVQTGGAPQSIERDDSSGLYPLNQPEWLDTNLNGKIDAPGTPTFSDGTIAPINADGTLNSAAEHTWPISYERSRPGQSVYISAIPVFKFFGSANGNWEIKGASSDAGSASFTFGPGQAVQSGGTLSADLECNQATPGTIDSQSLTISWKISINGGVTWFNVPVGVSKNHLFVSGGSAQQAFETVLYVGCIGAQGLQPHDPDEDNTPTHSYPAGQATSEDEGVAEAIFDSEFTSLTMHDVEGNLLTYWGAKFGLGVTFPAPRDGAVQGTALLLKYHDARCGEWASDFFRDVLSDQGVGSVWKDLTMSFTHAVPESPANDSAGFYTPERAQGGRVPTEQWFADHVIVEYVAGNGSCVLFDPSYGVRDSGSTVEAAQLAWGAQAIAAGVRGDWVAQGGFTTEPVIDRDTGNTVWVYGATGYVQGSALFPIVPADFFFGPAYN